MLPGYRNPRTEIPEGRYPEDWTPWERVHPPLWSQFQQPAAGEWLNPTELLPDRNLKRPAPARKTTLLANDIPFPP
jgi:hypothetical protein